MKPTKFEFDGKNVSMRMESYLLDTRIDSKVYEGTFEVNGNEITFDFDSRKVKAWSDTFDFEMHDGEIVIDGITYEKD